MRSGIPVPTIRAVSNDQTGPILVRKKHATNATAPIANIMVRRRTSVRRSPDWIKSLERSPIASRLPFSAMPRSRLNSIRACSFERPSPRARILRLIPRFRPTAPKTGYGYIQAASRSGDSAEAVMQVERFVEKPDAANAATFVEDGSYYWNSGIFLFRPSAFLAELKRHAPDVAVQVEKAMGAATTDAQFVRPDPTLFAAVRDISVDYAVMEHSEKVMVVPVGFAWSDVGSWDAVRELLPTDEHGNVLKGDVLALDTTNSLIRSDADITVAVVGLDQVVCVVTEDAVFIAALDRAQDVKKVVEELRARGHARV